MTRQRIVIPALPRSLRSLPNERRWLTSPRRGSAPNLVPNEGARLSLLKRGTVTQGLPVEGSICHVNHDTKLICGNLHLSKAKATIVFICG